MDGQLQSPRFLGYKRAATEFQLPRIVRGTNVMCLRTFMHRIKGKSVQILSDNATTVAMINGMGGPIKSLDTIAR